MSGRLSVQASSMLLALGAVYVIAGLGLGSNRILLGVGGIFFLIGLARLARGLLASKE